MAKRVRKLHSRVSGRKPGQLLEWWQGLTPSERKKEKARQYARFYSATAAGKKAHKKYVQSEKGRETSRRKAAKYAQSARGRETRKKCQRKYEQTPKGKAVLKRYAQSEKGKRSQQRYRKKFLEELALRLRGSRSTASHPLEALISRERAAVVEDAIASLPEEEAAVIKQLFGFEGQSLEEEEIARKMGKTPLEVRQIAARAIGILAGNRRLRELL
jgi:hypothetical protein